jgi:apolipoprotein N-acyltransferase
VILARLAHSIILAWGWRRAATALAAGGVSSLALAPTQYWPVLFLTFPILVWLVDGAAAGRFGGVGAAFIAGWWFGFGYFLIGLYWIGNAFLVDAKIFGWLLPIAVAGLPAGLALFTGFGLALARLLWTRGPIRLLALAVALTIAEWLRGHVLTGFPWNTFGYALTTPLPLAQGVALFGIWGLTFLAIAVFASPAVLADDRAESKRAWLPLALGVTALCGLALFGFLRLQAQPTSFVDGVRLRIMQPNLREDEKFSLSKRQVMDRYVSLSDRPTSPDAAGMQDVTHLIWPESAFPFFLTREPDALAQIAALLSNKAVLITGGVRLAEPAVSGPITRAYNSIYVIAHDGSIQSVYDKVHLVPFGEYLPLQDLLERFGLMQLTKVQGGFLAGDRRRILSVPGAPSALPLICYEIIFPHDVVPGPERPHWLVNVTNDAWFGNSPGPHQHLQQARVQAIAEGLPLVRAANTGISAIVDPLGRVTKSLALGTEGVLDARLPERMPPTLYARTGDTLIGLVLAASLIIVVRRRSSRA